jgi:hypothetical protein
MFNYGKSPLKKAPISFSFGAGEDPTTAAYEAMQSEAQKKRMEEMMRLAGYRGMQYSAGPSGGSGMLSKMPQAGGSLLGGGSMFQGSGSSFSSGQPLYRPNSLFQAASNIISPTKQNMMGGGFSTWSTPTFPQSRI